MLVLCEMVQYLEEENNSALGEVVHDEAPGASYLPSTKVKHYETAKFLPHAKLIHEITHPITPLS